MTMKERLKTYLEYKNITYRRFSQLMGVSNGYVTAMKKGMPVSKLHDLSEKFPDLNIEWLTMGVGEMLNPGCSQVIQNQYRATGVDASIIPSRDRFPIVSSEMVAARHFDISKFLSKHPGEFNTIRNRWSVSDASFVYRVEMDTMEPYFRPGDLVLMQEKEDGAAIYKGIPYGIDTVDMGLMIRIIKEVDENGTLNLQSYNREKYPDFSIRRDDYYKLYRLVGLMRTNI